MKSAVVGSLRWRIVLGALLWSAGLMLAGSIASLIIFHHHLEERYKLRLDAHLSELETLFLNRTDGAQRLGPLSEPRFGLPRSGYYWQIDTLPPRTPVLRSPSLGPSRLDAEIVERALEAGGLFETTFDDKTHEVASRPVELDGQTYLLSVAADQDILDPGHKGHRKEEILLTVLPPLALLLLAVGLQRILSAFRPLKDLSEKLASVRRGETQHLEGSYPNEIAPLINELNALLEFSRRSVARGKAQAADLAHALKTPLAVVMNETERLESDGHLQPAAIIREQMQSLRRHVEAHLARSRAASINHPNGLLRCSVKATAHRLCRTMERLYTSKAIKIELVLEPALVFRGEDADLEELLGNLLDNACKWTRSTVVIHGSCEGDSIVLTVEDNGPGLSAQERRAALDRGTRLDETQPGTGLGLAIVREIVQLYGGRLELGASELGGLKTTLFLPSVRAEEKTKPAGGPASSVSYDTSDHERLANLLNRYRFRSSKT